MYDVITVGSAAIDVFPVISQKIKDCKLGDKVLVEDIKFEPGGGGVNAAVGLARMGLNVAFLGKLGHDHNAFKLIHELKKENVKLIKTAPSEYPTSYSVVLKSKQEKDRIIFVYKGASDHLCYPEIKKSELKTKWIYLATMLKQSFKTSIKIAKFAQRNSIKLMFNPSTYLAKQGKSKLRPILKAATILVLNKEEAKLLLKTKKDYVPYLAQELYKLGPKIVIVTEGPKGVAAYDGAALYSLPAYSVKVVSTAGAGDAFASGFLAGLLHKQDIAHALQMGNANAASVIQFVGTKNKLLTHRQAHMFIKNRKEKVLVRRL
ncbi:MAG: carbohydrate kinase family protein [Candidatus Woesearchaeota archaeon]